MLRHPKAKALTYSSLHLLHEERDTALVRPLLISQTAHSLMGILFDPFPRCLERLPVFRGLQRPREGFAANPGYHTEAAAWGSCDTGIDVTVFAVPVRARPSVWLGGVGKGISKARLFVLKTFNQSSIFLPHLPSEVPGTSKACNFLGVL